MSACFPCGSAVVIPVERGYLIPTLGVGAMGVFRLPTDPVGQAAVMFSGVVAGSEIRVFLSDMTELAGIESCAADQVLTWNVYASGSPNNTVRIKIINMAYKIKDFTYTAQAGNQNIPVQMEPDRWFSNP